MRIRVTFKDFYIHIQFNEDGFVLRDIEELQTEVIKYCKQEILGYHFPGIPSNHLYSYTVFGGGIDCNNLKAHLQKANFTVI